MRFQPGKLRKPLAEPVKPKHLSLQFSELDCHRVEVALQQLLGLGRLGSLVGKQNGLEKRMFDCCGVSQSHIVEQQREAKEQYQEAKPAERPVAPVQRERPGLRRGARHEDYVQMRPPLRCLAC